MEQTLNIESREGTGKGVCRKLRASGKLPGVLYGLGQNKGVTVDPRIIHKLLMTQGGRNMVLSLKGPGVDGKHVLIKDYQVDPVSRALLHVDLLEIDTSKKIQVTVVLSFTGKALGVAEGGVLNYIERTLEVKCFPNKIPAHIDVDVSALTIGDSIHLAQVTMPEGVESVSQTNPTLVTCVPPTKEEEAVAALAPTAEPEVITEKKPAEGEAPAAEGKETGKEDKKEDKKKKD